MRASPAAALRIYEPLAAFPPDERPRWERYARSGSAPSRAEGARREREITMDAAVRRRLDPVPSGGAPSSGSAPHRGQADTGPGGSGIGAEQAFTQRVDGLLYVCPWRLQIRVWQAAQEFRTGLPRLLADAFIPAAVAARAEAALERLRLRGAELKVPVRCSTWTIPLPWLCVFDPAERVLVIGRGPAKERSLIYATPMAQARRRVARALSVLRRTLPDALSVAGLEDVGRWLEEFHPHSLVELDYGGLAALLSDAELRAETSVADVAEALAALADSDGEKARDAYARLMRRLRRLQAVEQAS
ncbi:MAG: hypothetical protein ACXV5Q_09065 [Frankiaceae bacterium]